MEKNETRITSQLLATVVKEQAQSFEQQKVGVTRDILSQLQSAINSEQIVVITGLRRVGKSTLLKQIADNLLSDEYYVVNFEDERLLNFTAQDFEKLHEVLISLYGSRKTFLLDEVQNVSSWEKFVVRLQRQGYKLIVTGSNASLLSEELATSLTGRSVKVELLPFSFQEYLSYQQLELKPGSAMTTAERGELLQQAKLYLQTGGIPNALKYPDLKINKTLYDDILYRDVAARLNVRNVKSLKELAFYLVSNTAAKLSFNNLKKLLKLGSVNTVKRYVDFLENSWLFLLINKYAYSVKEQQIAAKKIYGIDTGLVNEVGFSFSANTGKLLENAVFLELRRQTDQIYYYETKKGYEVDFFLPQERVGIQVSQHLEGEELREREFRSLVELAKEQKEMKRLVVVTMSSKDRLKIEGQEIEVVPIYEWLFSL